MKTQMTIMIAAVTAAAGFAWRAYAAGKARHLTMTVASELKWTPADPKNEKSPLITTVWGDPRKGPAGFIMKVPPGGEAPIHSHSHDYYAVVISGAPSHGHTKEDAKVMSPGGHWFQPGKQWHFDACTGDADCIFLINMTGKLDYHFLNVPPAAKK